MLQVPAARRRCHEEPSAAGLASCRYHRARPDMRRAHVARARRVLEQRCRHLLRAGLLACTLLGQLAVADTGTLARVGPFAIDAATFQRRAALVAPLEWPELGASWREQRRRFLDDVLVAEGLLAVAAEQAPAALPSARDRALARTLEATLASETSRAVPSEADVAAYRERYRAELDTPRTLSLWRILLVSEADARAVIAQLSPLTEAAWSRLARERSTDRATNMRAGNLGRVAADGQTHMPELRVSPALFAAADRVKDGELVGSPVPEGDAFAVVWRRASQPARESSPASVATSIAARLGEQRFATARAQLIEALRRAHLADHQPERVASFEPQFTETGAPLPRLDGELPVRPVRLLPELTDRGLR
jgi:hypothetical protein